jgi:hypothetical protein
MSTKHARDYQYLVCATAKKALSVIGPARGGVQAVYSSKLGTVKGGDRGFMNTIWERFMIPAFLVLNRR